MYASASQSQIWSQSPVNFIIIVITASVGIIVLIGIFCFFLIKYSSRKLSVNELQHLNPEAYPKPNLNLLQPSLLTKPHRSLQERRGSNSSLTLSIESISSASSNSEGLTLHRADCSHATKVLENSTNELSLEELSFYKKDVLRIYKEFLSLPMNIPDKYLIGVSNKNRHKYIWPSPSTRIILEGSDYTDSVSSYINANYVRGYDDRYGAFIATQGPMYCTFSDFWWMIWQENSRVIVMLTKLRERNKIKCDRYWPIRLKQPEVFRNIQVSVDSILHHNNYTTTVLVLLNLISGQSRIVRHVWYSGWPDQTTPDKPVILLNIIRDIRETLSTEITPICVHCSAGIGRTGCFIAIFNALEQIETEGKVDILKIISQMRLDRGGMVQSNEQYEFIYECASEYSKSLTRES